jgi:hypothetical protein
VAKIGGKKIKADAEELATHTSGLQDFPAG